MGHVRICGRGEATPSPTRPGALRHSPPTHVMSCVLDEGLALFARLNVIPKRSFLTDYSCRIDPACYPKVLRGWFSSKASVRTLLTFWEYTRLRLRKKGVDEWVL